MPSVLFVCMANQYRSPLAGAYFCRELDLRAQTREWTVESAGTWAQPDLPAALQAQQAALEAGLSLDTHVTRQVSLELLRRFDLILAMEVGQVEAMRTEFPSMASKIHLLTEVARGISYSIPDPMMSDEGWSQIPAELHQLIQQGFDGIVTLANTLHKNSLEE